MGTSSRLRLKIVRAQDWTEIHGIFVEAMDYIDRLEVWASLLSGIATGLALGLIIGALCGFK